MADPNHPRKFTEKFRRQIVQLYLAGKPRGELMVEYDLGSSTLFRWIKCRGEAGVCLLAGPHNREIVGHAASGRKDARLAKAAFATLGFPPADIDVLRADRGGEFANPGIDGLLEAFDIRRSLSRKGDPHDNAVIEPANRIPKKKLAYRRAFADLGQLRREPNPCVRWRNEKRMHSTLGYMSPVEFRNAGLSL